MDASQTHLLERDRRPAVMDRIQVESLGRDIVGAVRRHVAEASVCIPVICTLHFDTHLLFTYCHKLCDESFREPILLKVMVVDDGSATLIRAEIPYNQSECLSLRRLLNKDDFLGVCFAWTERMEDSKGFRVGHKRLTPIFYAFYQQNSGAGQKLDLVHSSPSRSSYEKTRLFWVPQDGTQVTGIVCAPLDAYQNRASRLTYTFGIKEEGGSWRHAKKEIPFSPTLWVNLGELFDMEFKTSSTYLYSVRGPKGKGWLLLQTVDDFNLHHL